MAAMEVRRVEEELAGEAEEVVPFDEIEKLENVGITMSDIQKLKVGGVYTIAGLRMRTKKVRACIVRRDSLADWLGRCACACVRACVPVASLWHSWPIGSQSRQDHRRCQ
jgi:hypothetical protein